MSKAIAACLTTNSLVRTGVTSLWIFIGDVLNPTREPQAIYGGGAIIARQRILKHASCIISQLICSITTIMSKLLQGGTVLLLGENDIVSPTKADILIQGDRMVRIEQGIVPAADCDVVDCTNKIISPGFIDTHHHLWQTMLKGLFGNEQFIPYLAIGKCSYVKRQNAANHRASHCS